MQILRHGYVHVIKDDKLKLAAVKKNKPKIGFIAFEKVVSKVST